MNWIDWLAIVGAVATVAAIIAIFIGGTRQLRDLEAWAKDHGWTFEEHPARFADQLRAFEPFSLRGRSTCTRLMTGTVDGRKARMFYVEHEAPGEDGGVSYSVLQVRMRRSAPDLVIRREGLAHKLFDALGGEDIDFESEEFSRRYWVRCGDRRFAHDVLSPRMMHFLLERGDTFWQWRGRSLLLLLDDYMIASTPPVLLSTMSGWLDRLPGRRTPQP